MGYAYRIYNILQILMNLFKTYLLPAVFISIISGCSSDSNLDKWIPIEFGKQVLSLGIAKQTISIPSIKESGKIKFLPSSPDEDLFVTGYVFDFDIGSLDQSTLPPNYQKPRKIVVMGNEYEEPPIKSLSLALKISLKLMDKDGFVITSLDDVTAKVITGQDGERKVNTIQGKLPTALQKRLIQQVSRIEGLVTLEECDTCAFMMKN